MSSGRPHEEIPHPPRVTWSGDGLARIRPEQRAKLEAALRAATHRVAGPPAGSVGGGLGIERQGRAPRVAVKRAVRAAPGKAAVVLKAPKGGGAAGSRLIVQPLGRRSLNYRALAEQLKEAMRDTGTGERAVWAALLEVEGDPDAVAELRSVYRTVYGRSLDEDIKGDFSGDEEWSAFELMSPLMRPEDLKLLRRLKVSPAVFRAARDLDEAEKWLAVARSGIGRSEDREEARERARRKVREAREHLDATARAAGFRDGDDYGRAENAFMDFLERYAWRIAMQETRDNEALVRAQARRYGADEPGRRVVGELYHALEPARLKMALHDAHLARVGKFSAHQMSYEEYQELQRVVHEVLPPLEKEARELIRGLGGRFPILLDRDLTKDDISIRGLVEANVDELRRRLQDTAADRLENILDVREDLAEEPELVWQIDPLIWRAAKRLGIPEGSIYEEIIAHKLGSVATLKTFKNLALAALGIGLGLLSGGTGYLAVAGAVGAAGVSTYTLLEEVQEYLFQRAAAGSAFDRAQALAAEDPSLIWLALSVVGTALDFVGVLEAFSRLRGPARAVMEGVGDVAKLRGEAEEALRGAGHPNPKLAADEIASRAERARVGAPPEPVPSALVGAPKREQTLKTWSPEELDRFEKHVAGFTAWEGVAGRTSKRTYMVRVGEAGPAKGGGMWGAALFDTEDEARAYARWLASTPEEELRRAFAIPHQWVGGDVSKFQAVKVFEVPAGTAILKGPVAPQFEAAARFVEVPAGATPQEMLALAERARTVPGGGPQVAIDPAVRVKPTDFEITLTKGEGTLAGPPAGAGGAPPPAGAGGGAAPPAGPPPPTAPPGGAGGASGGTAGGASMVVAPSAPNPAFTLERASMDQPGRYLPFTDPDPSAVAGLNLHTVDAANRPLKAEGWLFPQPAVRDSGAQAFVSDPFTGAHAAHLIPARYHGTGRAVNLVAFPAEVNLSQMKVFENMIGDRLAAGQQLYLQAFVKYTDEGQIPAEITYRVFQQQGGRLVKTDDRIFDLLGGVWVH
jgi:hypothetical protein